MNVGDKFEINDILYQVTSVEEQPQSDGTLVTVVNSQPV